MLYELHTHTLTPTLIDTLDCKGNNNRYLTIVIDTETSIVSTIHNFTINFQTWRSKYTTYMYSLKATADLCALKV